ncbi:MAG: hypothetical protein CVT73_14865, partial [Alphaproteobacteria bacterium HGW-Alphaproteobacteria-12]
IVEGEAAMLVEGEGGPPRALRLDSGDLIGETALFKPERRRTCVRAVTRLLTLRIGRDMFQRLLGEFPEMAGAVATRLANRLDNAGADLRVLQMRFDRNGKKGRGQKE